MDDGADRGRGAGRSSATRARTSSRCRGRQRLPLSTRRASSSATPKSVTCVHDSKHQRVVTTARRWASCCTSLGLKRRPARPRHPGGDRGRAQPRADVRSSGSSPRRATSRRADLLPVVRHSDSSMYAGDTRSSPPVSGFGECHLRRRPTSTASDQPHRARPQRDQPRRAPRSSRSAPSSARPLRPSRPASGLNWDAVAPASPAATGTSTPATASTAACSSTTAPGVQRWRGVRARAPTSPRREQQIAVAKKVYDARGLEPVARVRPQPLAGLQHLGRDRLSSAAAAEAGLHACSRPELLPSLSVRYSSVTTVRSGRPTPRSLALLRSVKYGLYGAVLAGLIAAPVVWNPVDKSVQLVVDGAARPRVQHDRRPRRRCRSRAAAYRVSGHDLLAPRRRAVHDGMPDRPAPRPVAAPRRRRQAHRRVDDRPDGRRSARRSRLLDR